MQYISYKNKETIESWQTRLLEISLRLAVATVGGLERSFWSLLFCAVGTLCVIS